MSLMWLAGALRDAQLAVREAPGWQDAIGAPPPLVGVRLRHTRDSPATCRPGGASVPGHVVVDRSAVCWVLTAGSLSGEQTPPGGSFVTIAVEYGARETNPPQYATVDQKAATIRAAALIADRLGLDHHAVVGRHESPRPLERDPFCWDMVLVRDAVRRCLERV